MRISDATALEKGRGGQSPRVKQNMVASGTNEAFVDKQKQGPLPTPVEHQTDMSVVLTRRPAESLGLQLDDDTMVFTDVIPNTAAARHGVLTRLKGKVLWCVNSHHVYFANDLHRLARGDSVTLYFRDQDKVLEDSVATSASSMSLSGAHSMSASGAYSVST